MKKAIIERRFENFCSELELVPTDIVPMVGMAWYESFADVSGNVQAILERGWNPLTKKLLLDPHLRRTMTEVDREEELNLGYLTGYKIQMIENSLELQADDITAPISNNDSTLNFNSGYACRMVDKLIGDTDLERARARTNQRAKFGENTKAMLKNMERLSAVGELVRVAMTHEVGIDLLSEMRMRRAEEKEAKDAKEQKKRVENSQN